MILLAVLVLVGWGGTMAGDWACLGADPTRACGRPPVSAPLVAGQSRVGPVVRFGVDFGTIRPTPAEAVANE